MERILRLTEALSGAVTVEEVASALARAGRAAVGATASFVWLLTPDGEEFELVSGEGDGGARIRLYERFSAALDLPVRDVARTGSPLVFTTQEDMIARYPLTARGGPSPYRSTAVVPLMLDGRGIGGVGLSFSHERPFTAEDQVLLTVMASQASLAFERCRLFEAERAARARAQQAASRTARLQRATAALAGAADSAQIGREVLRLGTESIGAAGGVLGRVAGDEAALELLDAEWMPRERFEALRRLPLTAPYPLSESARERRAIWVESEAQFAREYPEVYASAQTRPRAIAAVPLLAGERVLGACAFGFRDDQTFSADDREFILAIARICAHALDRARLYESERQARASLEETNARLEATVAALRGQEAEVRRALESAREADRRKDEFLAMLGHELRNPLAPILTAAELLRMRGVASGHREVGIIERQGRHLVRLVDDLLDVSRITRGKITLERAPVEISTLVAAAVETTSTLIAQRRHELVVNAPAAGLAVLADPARITQVLSNLLVNAARYTAPGGRIEVVAERRGGEAAVSVRDNGAGIAPDLLPILFEPFVQGERSIDRADGGLGLGLALVRSLVDLHGGRVHARSEGPGQGSVFEIVLPLLADGQIAPAPAAPGAGGDAGPPIAGRRILIVDDNRDAADLLADALSDLGPDARVETDPVAALRALNDFAAEVAIVDIGLPVMSGYELGARLRERLGRAIQLVAVTGYGQESDRERSRNAGLDAHLVKPIDLGSLVEVVSRLRGAAPPG
ncbi:MAG: GAF domain-containing protein [Polyangiaceae bacterium]|nr:GAF domain-containing protein [Polyangiaceae bacterium]